MLLLCASLSSGMPSYSWAQPVGLPSMGVASADQLSPYMERQLGDVIMAEGRRDPTYIGDPEINQYLTTMGRKLASFSPGTVPNVDLFAVRDPEINAFAMPGGYIGVNSGLVVATKSESELAAVLAHEIGHVVQRHIARGMTQGNQTGAIMLASIAGALLAALAGGGGNLAMGVAAFGQAAAIDRQLGFSRDAEREADRAGFQMLTGAGYNPDGMSHMFERLMNASRLNEGIGGGAWASTHPLSIDRMSDIENRVRNLPPGHHVDTDDYWYVRAKLRVIQGQDTAGLRTSTQQFQDEAHTLTGVQQSAAYYGLALGAMRRDDPAGADRYLKLATADGRSSPELDRLAIDVANAQKDYARALSLAEAAWKAWPGRYAIAIAYVQALQQVGRDDQAQNFLRERIKQWGEDEPVFYQLLAQSEEKSGNRVQARRDMATYYTAIGALPAAEAQLRQAREMSRDFYVSSQIDVQIKQLKDKIDDQRQLLQRFKS
ncbi:MAG TPA: M48 family metalloprotease [Bordetella sp.]|nr:M48 family metalloprotease [Bordetella sp.]